MVFSSNVYSVLVVSAAEKFNDTIASLLPSSSYYPVKYVSNIAAAKRTFLEQRYDFVIINTPLPDELGARFAMDACSGTSTVALLLVRTEIYDEVCDKVSDSGVFTLAKPTTVQILSQALRWMGAVRERLRRLEKKATSIEEKMEEIRLVNRAKWLLIEKRNMSESDAHHHIEKQAMDRCISRREVSLDIIHTYS